MGDALTQELIAPGHRGCAGCCDALAAKLVLDAAGPDCIVVSPTGCLEVFTTPYPESAWGVPWIHSLFENAAAVASGVEAALKVMNRKGSTKIIAMGGDGATLDIGLQAISGAFERGHDFTYICIDNEAYMNTGVQRSSATPLYASTTTSPSGKASLGNPLHKKNMPAILAAHGSPYVATASVSFAPDLKSKVKKALETPGPAYIHVHAPCCTGWGFDGAQTIRVGRLAVETALWPLYEMETGVVTKARKIKNRKPVEEYLKLQGRFKHLFKGDAAGEISRIQALADWNVKHFGLE